MKIGILNTSVRKNGGVGFYNSQDIGLAKELSKLADEVLVYKLIPQGCEDISKTIEGCNNAFLNRISSKSYGINGIMNPNQIDPDIDALIYFSDLQLMVPRVYKWAKSRNVRFIPYIGALESHSTSKVKKILMNLLSGKNLKVYRKCSCLVKTPSVEKELRDKGVNDITVTPVGLDLSLMHQNYEEADKDELKLKYGFKSNEKVILFIGRLVDEKQPLKMIQIFSQLYMEDPQYRLLMVGTGQLRDAVDEKIKDLDLADVVMQIEKIPNSDIWELYRLADCFVNLNQQEIFGMAILEAMYYGCKVVAWHAPGPDFIIEDGVSGYLVDSDSEIYERIINSESTSENAHQRILEHFTWETTAKIIKSEICKVKK